MIIYKITNLINGKIYIGKDVHNNSKYFGSGVKIKLAIKKYGKNNFIKEIIEHCDDLIELNNKEMFWINQLNATNDNIGYNISLGGDGGDTISNNPNKNVIATKHSNMMKQYHKLNPKPKKQYVRKKDDPNWVNPNKGKKRTNVKIIKSRKGILNPKHSEWMKNNNPFKGKYPNKTNLDNFIQMVKKPKDYEHRKKISESLKGHKPPNMKKILINNIEYESLSSASKILSIPISTIKNRLKSNGSKFSNYKYIE